MQPRRRSLWIGDEDSWFQVRIEPNRQKVYVRGPYSAKRKGYLGFHFGFLCGRPSGGFGL